MGFFQMMREGFLIHLFLVKVIPEEETQELKGGIAGTDKGTEQKLLGGEAKSGNWFGWGLEGTKRSEVSAPTPNPPPRGWGVPPVYSSGRSCSSGTTLA